MIEVIGMDASVIQWQNAAAEEVALNEYRCDVGWCGLAPGGSSVPFSAPFFVVIHCTELPLPVLQPLCIPRFSWMWQGEMEMGSEEWAMTASL